MQENININLPIDNILEGLIKIIQKTIVETLEAQNKFEPSSAESDLLTRQQTCKLLGISAPTLDARIKDGSLPYCRIGKKVLFDKNSILSSIARKVGKR